MTEEQAAEPIPLRTRLPALLPLAAVWACALLPVVLYLLYLKAPEQAVGLAISIRSLLLQALVALVVTATIGLTLYPPLPAWLRRSIDRTRTAWTTDRSLLTRALSELKHFETAQKHYEIARVAWTLGDEPLAGPHLRRSTELDPTLAYAQHLFGQYLLRVGSLPEARHAFEAAEQLDKGHAFGDALLHAAHLQHLTGDTTKALQTFEQHAQDHGASPRSNFWRANALLAAGQDEAAARCLVAAAADPKTRLTAEENWFRALARVRCWGIRGKNSLGSKEQT